MAIEGYFTTSLQPHILAILKLQLDRPGTMEQWYDAAIKVERNDRYYKDVNLESATHSALAMAKATEKELPPGEPMDIGAARLSREE